MRAAPGKYHQPRHRLMIRQQIDDDAAEEPHLDVGVRYRQALEVDVLVEHVGRAQRRQPVALEAGKGRVALTDVRGTARQIERPGRRAAVAHDGREPAGRGGRAVEGGHGRGARQAEVPRVTLERQGHGLQAGARTRLIDERVPIARRPTGGRNAKHRVQLRVRAHRHEAPAGRHVRRKQRGLPGGQRRLRQHHQPGRGQRRRRQRRQVDDVETIQAFGLQNLRQIRTERIRRGTVHDHEEWGAPLGTKIHRGKRHDHEHQRANTLSHLSPKPIFCQTADRPQPKVSQSRADDGATICAALRVVRMALNPHPLRSIPRR